MSETPDGGQRLYKARGPDGEVTWVGHEELWRLQQGQVERLRRQRARRHRLLLLALAGLVLLVLVLALLRLRPAVGTAPAGEIVAAVPAGAPEDGVGTGGFRSGAAPDAELEPARPDVSPPEPPAAAVLPTEEVAGAVRGWAAAWARQDVAAYLESYAAAFVPADGASRSSWRALRRQRLTEPASILVEIEDLEIAPRGGDRAEARFLQTYRSPAYFDVVRKSLELVEEEGRWRIVAERADSP